MKSSTLLLAAVVMFVFAVGLTANAGISTEQEQESATVSDGFFKNHAGTIAERRRRKRPPRRHPRRHERRGRFKAQYVGECISTPNTKGGYIIIYNRCDVCKVAVFNACGSTRRVLVAPGGTGKLRTCFGVTRLVDEDECQGYNP